MAVLIHIKLKALHKIIIDHTGRKEYNVMDHIGLRILKGVISITHKFESLEEEKKNRILNAAFKVFAENSYEQASTNAVVKEAQIGKGMLFYYFKNKKALYRYLVEYSFDFIKEKYLVHIDGEERDLIERFRKTTIIKMQAFREFPHVFNFIGNVLVNGEEQLPEGLKPKYIELQRQGFAKLYENIDYSLFRDDIDREKAFQLIQWSIDGYQEHIKAKLKDENITTLNMDKYWEEFNEYLEVLRTSFYKKGVI
ncbi:TetR family transcriptional regulator [Halobacillus andaensis]|uniref:TetR family transcriptional regulator n=1 Tax=Halobacillus andaensis TaxID=1176239 RepID=A0A917AYY3_HALAA|nr:TetR/AcrR family transcriptional regulator [Halobacillus andaensis]MBP2003175.1 AcrR family transcriptional regulator [Halobacillus andaensis]GGF08591.1 TetR family transcriptional regulator [Halobacillus andaensis]